MKIRTKLIIYTVLSVAITMIVVGLSINMILTDLYSNSARSELNHSYQQFMYETAITASESANAAQHIAYDPQTVALAYLVDRYQDHQNYQQLIVNNEKMKLAESLLHQAVVTTNIQVVVYDRNGKMIAFASNSNDNRMTGYSVYENNKLAYLSKNAHEKTWYRGELPWYIFSSTTPSPDRQAKAYSGVITGYQSNDDRLFIMSSSRLLRKLADGREELLGSVMVAKFLDDGYLKKMTGISRAELTLLLHDRHVLNNRGGLLNVEQIESTRLQYGEAYPDAVDLLENENYFYQAYRWSEIEGNNFLVVSLPKSDLNIALNKTRRSTVITFIVTGIFVVIIGLYWLNRLVTRPLYALAEQAEFTKTGYYPNFSYTESNDEISRLGKTLNSMVETIRTREADLSSRTRKLNNAQRLAKVGDWELDIATGNMKWSDETWNIFGLDPETVHPSSSVIQSLIHPDDVESTQEAYDSSLANRKPFNVIHRIFTPERKIKTIKVFAEYIFDESQKPVLLVGTIQDITEQAHKDEQLRRSQKMDALGKLTGGIAHDFNNMLGVIIGFTELLATTKAVNDPKARDYISQVLNSAERAKKLTAKLLGFSRKETSTLKVTDINSLLQGERDMLEKTMTVRIQLNMDLEAQLWPVYLDRDELEDAIVNMSINAMHAMPDHGTLTFITRNITDGHMMANHLAVTEGDYVLLSVIDTGAGMDYATLQQAFEPFFSTKKEKGTGLGLSQVYGFVQRSKGRVEIFSQPGEGTRIDMYFPRYMQNTPVVELNNEPEPDENLSGNATILVVDDEESLRTLESEILMDRGYRVLLAEDAEKALALLEINTVDLVLTDVIMPGMTGYELAEKISELYPLVKIQVVSGYSDSHEVNTSGKYYFEHRMRKPFSPRKLLQRISQLLKETEVQQ